MRSFTVIDVDHETAFTVIGSAQDVATKLFTSAKRPVAAVEFTRVFWTNPDEDPGDEWQYAETPVYVRPEAVRAVSGLNSYVAHSLERSRVEAD